VIVKAKVPIRNQWKEYTDALATARGYAQATDIPIYKGYQVERAEVTDQGPGEWKTLVNVVPNTLIRQMETWPIQTPDDGLVNPKTKHPLLTFPLPPMVLRSWDSSVTHSELPPPSPDEMMGGEGLDGDRGRGEGGRRRDNDEGAGGDEFEQATAPPPGAAGQGGFGGRGFDGGRGGFDGGRGGFDGGRGGFGGGRGGFDGGFGGGRGGFDGGRISTEMMGGGAGAYDPAQFEQYSWDGTTRFLLFRFFDMDVQPGKRYQYRVRLVLKDVNQEQSPTNPAGPALMYLDESVIERRQADTKSYRLTPWSDASPVAVVPQAGLVFVAGAKAANRANFADEPEAEMLIKTLDTKSAAEAALADYFTRGSVLNLIGEKAKIIWSNTFEAYDRKGEQVESPDYEFRTGLTVLDFDGGEALFGNRDLTAPARAMLMDAAGRMWIKSELEDATPVVEYDAYMEMAAEQARQDAERERGGGGGGRGDGGRGGGGRGGGGGGRGGRGG
jgi:uncharacterized membrane protein YgcG